MPTALFTPARVGIHNVLIATDFSRYSNAALDFGLHLARTYQANSYVVFVMASDQFLLAGPEAYVAAKDAASRDLQGLKEELQTHQSFVEGKDYHLFLLEGEVVESILNFARQKEVDLIVVGTHGRGGLGRALMGSVAESVFRHSPVPVLTIGPHVHSAGSAMAPKNIIFASDFSPASRQAAQYAAALARENNAKLTLLHVLDPSSLDGVADREYVIHWIENRLLALLGEDTGGLQFVCRVEVGHVVPAILRVADDIQADLLVLRVRPSAGVLDRLMWPHAFQLVREAACPVLTVRDEVVQQ